MKKPAILLLTFTLFVTTSWAQNITDKNQTVVNSATTRFVTTATDLPIFSSSSDAEKIVERIMEAVGLEGEGNFKIKVANVPNVEATIRHHRRYILYNADFVNRVNALTNDKWASIFILAHEVGHHLEGHTLTNAHSRPSLELQADQFAGFALCKMGATLEQAQLAMHFIANIDASKTHPGRADRLAAIEKGWNKAESLTKSSVYLPNTTSGQTAARD